MLSRGSWASILGPKFRKKSIFRGLENYLVFEVDFLSLLAPFWDPLPSNFLLYFRFLINLVKKTVFRCIERNDHFWAKVVFSFDTSSKNRHNHRRILLEPPEAPQDGSGGLQDRFWSIFDRFFVDF